LKLHTISLPTPDGLMAVYEALPDGEARACVIVAQEGFGVNGHIEGVARRFAAAGHHALVPHLYHRSGDPVIKYGDTPAVLQQFEKVSAQTLHDDLAATIAYAELSGHDARDVAVVGWCMGGVVAFAAATMFDIGAAVTFYGAGVGESRLGCPAMVDAVSQLRAPWLGIFGDRDRGIPVEQVKRLRAVLPHAPVQAELVRYADAEHGFFCDERPSYHEASARDGWARTLAWLHAHLAAPVRA